MIIQTGLRTDIPAFYSEWFLNRLREGYVLVRNPYHPGRVTRYELSPRVVDLIGFCTKNPAPMLPHMEALREYGQYWYVTVTPYGREIEPNVPPKETVLEDVKRLSRMVGVDSVGWRYDPIFISAEYPLERHIADFTAMAHILFGYTHTCVISFIDLYQKVRRNFPEAREVTAKERISLAKAFVQIGRECGMTIKACAEGKELADYGVDCSGCMTIETYEKALHGKLLAPKVKPWRSGCGCYLSCDIGQYDTCGHLCRYCYANNRAEAVRRNRVRHDPASPFLIGGPEPGDQIHAAVQERWLDRQLSLFE